MTEIEPEELETAVYLEKYNGAIYIASPTESVHDFKRCIKHKLTEKQTILCDMFIKWKILSSAPIICAFTNSEQKEEIEADIIKSHVYTKKNTINLANTEPNVNGEYYTRVFELLLDIIDAKNEKHQFARPSVGSLLRYADEQKIEKITPNNTIHNIEETNQPVKMANNDIPAPIPAKDMPNDMSNAPDDMPALEQEVEKPDDNEVPPLVPASPVISHKKPDLREFLAKNRKGTEKILDLLSHEKLPKEAFTLLWDSLKIVDFGLLLNNKSTISEDRKMKFIIDKVLEYNLNYDNKYILPFSVLNQCEAHFFSQYYLDEKYFKFYMKYIESVIQMDNKYGAGFELHYDIDVNLIINAIIFHETFSPKLLFMLLNMLIENNYELENTNNEFNGIDVPIIKEIIQYYYYHLRNKSKFSFESFKLYYSEKVKNINKSISEIDGKTTDVSLPKEDTISAFEKIIPQMTDEEKLNIIKKLLK